MRSRVSVVLFFLGTILPSCESDQGDSCSYTFHVPHEDGCSIMDGQMSQLTTTVNELHAQVTSLVQQNTGLLQHNLQLLQDNAHWRQVVAKQIEENNVTSSTGSSGGAYTRWGRKVCPGDAELIYAGRAAGSYYDHPGGISELLCLPEDPEWGQFVDGFQGESFIYGTEYQSHLYETNNIFLRDNVEDGRIADHNVPCAVCFTPGRGLVKKFPAKLNCPTGWQKEYAGYLMAGYYSHKNKVQGVCVDEAPEAAEAGLENENGALLYNIEAKCGSLPCPGYVAGRELTCAVCSR